MTNQAKRLAVVPARGGSKRIPRKNIRDFCGAPMMSHIIKAAQDSGLFDAIHVSTDDAEIRSVAIGLGLEPEFSRPAELADDTTTLLPVLRFVIEEYARQGHSFDQAWVLMPCAPLLTAEDLQAVGNRADERRNGEAVLCVSAHRALVERSFFMVEDGTLAPLSPEYLSVRTQDLPEYYVDAGACAAFPADGIAASSGDFWPGKIVPLRLPRESAVDIDTEEDWRFAELVFIGRQSMQGS